MSVVQASQLFCRLFCLYVASSDENFDSAVVSIFKNVNVTLTVSFASLDESFPQDKVLKDASSFENLAIKVLGPGNAIQFEEMNIIVAKTFADVTKLMTKAFKAHGIFVVIVTEAFERGDILNFFATARKLKIVNLGVVHRENEFLKTSFLPAFSDFCENRYNDSFLTETFTPVMSNLFSRPTNKPDDCSIKMTTFNSPPFVIIKNKTITGRDIDLMTAISKALKFKITYSIVDGDSPWVCTYSMYQFNLQTNF